MSEETQDANPEQEAPAQETAPQSEVSLETEAQGAVEINQSYEFDSLEDIQEPALRAAVQKYTSRAVNQAKEKWTTDTPRQVQQEAPPSQTNNPDSVSREELSRMLEMRDRENQLRYEAGKRLRNVFEDAGISPDSSQHKQVVTYYQEQKDSGRMTPEVLLSEAGIRSLIHASGALLPDAGGPQGGQSTRVPEHVQNTTLQGGDIQLGNSGQQVNESDPSFRAREAMKKVLRGQ